MSRYVASLERDRSGCWIVAFPAIPQAHTYGRSLRQAKGRAREVLALWVDDPERAEVGFEIGLPPELASQMDQLRSRGRELAEEMRHLRDRHDQLMIRLRAELHLSARDVADLLRLIS